ncbi:MAG: PP2C family protein-serine/threonine phosphatase [Candidatus Dormibacteria bacterium]
MKVRFGLAEQVLHGDDRALVEPELGLFGVLDGLGGVARSDEAAQLAATVIARVCRESSLPPREALAAACDLASQEVIDQRLGCTTATLVWIVGSQAHWASIGDSRLYHVGADGLRQVSRDQGEGNWVDNAIGAAPSPPYLSLTQQQGTLALSPGDKLVLVTDGITGDFPPDILDPTEITGALAGVDPEAAAQALVEIARKHDDRTALVICLR